MIFKSSRQNCTFDLFIRWACPFVPILLYIVGRIQILQGVMQFVLNEHCNIAL